MRKTATLLFALAAISCGKSKDNDKTVAPEEIPDVCKSMSLVGTFPVGGGENVTTYAFSCFEGYQMRDGKKWYLAPSKCGDAKLGVAAGDETAKKYYQPLDSKSCPLDDVIATCDMGTAKTVVYKSDADAMFEKDAFEAYCTENKGIALFK